MVEGRCTAAVGFMDELLTVFIEGAKEKMMQKPEMHGVLAIESVKTFKSHEKGLPSPTELFSNLSPQALYTLIMCRSENIQHLQNLIS